MHGRLQTLAGQHKGERTEYGLSDEDGQHQCNDRPCIADEYLRVYQHTDGYEEDGTKEVFDRFHQLLYFLGFNSLCQDATHDESTEGRRETNLCGEYGHGAAKS